MVQLDRLASVYVAKPLIEAGVARTAAGIPILMYHSISNDPEPGVMPYYRLATSPSRFAEQMQWLVDWGYEVIDLREALRRFAEGSADCWRAVVITFDDGFRDFYTHAWPVLAHFEFTATMFLPTAFISDTPQSFKGRKCLTWSEVRELQRGGMTFGSHTVSHPRLHGAEWTTITQELAQSRETLQQQLQGRVDTFAFPYAFPREDQPFAARFRTELALQGYAVCVTTVIGRANRFSDPLCLQRLPVNDADDRSLFRVKLSGAYDWVGRVQMAARRAKRSVRTARLR